MIVMHLSDMGPNQFGGFTVNSLCRRSRTLNDGGNLVENESEVTCKFRLAILRKRKQQAARKGGE